MRYWKEIIVVVGLIFAVSFKLYEKASLPKNDHKPTINNLELGKQVVEEPSAQASGSHRREEPTLNLHETEVDKSVVSKGMSDVHQIEKDRIRYALELFPDLNVEKWYYEEKEKGIKQKTDAAFVNRGNPSELRLLKLIELKHGDMISFRNESDLASLSKKFTDLNQSRATFADGQEILSNLDDLKSDVPICSIKFNRSTTERIMKNHRLIWIDRSELIKLNSGFHGVRVWTRTNPGQSGFWIESFDCVVRDSESSIFFDREIAFIHFIATIGINADLRRGD